MSTDDADGGEAPVQWPCLRARRPRAGRIHAASLADVRRVLAFFGERCFYGLREIELVRGDDDTPNTPLRLGRLVVPGRIELYDHLPSPWTLHGRLAPPGAERLRRAGALVDLIGAGHHTDVNCEEWDRLARKVTFVRVDVPARDYVYHYRLVATIALAEVARQVGRRTPAAAGRPRRRAPFYDRALELLD